MISKAHVTRILLLFVVGATLLPVFLSKVPRIKLQDNRGLVSLSITSSNLVPFVIAASFTRITDDDNNLIIDEDRMGGTTREKILETIEQTPGVHFRDICRRLNKEIGVVQYHVYILKRFNIITSMRDGRYTRFFAVSSGLDDLSKKVVCCWHRPVERQILLALKGDTGTSVNARDLVDTCNVTMQAITWHLDRMTRQGVVSVAGKKNVILPSETRRVLGQLLDGGLIA